MKILGVELYGITMPNTIQLREYSRSSGRDGIVHNIARLLGNLTSQLLGNIYPTRFLSPSLKGAGMHGAIPISVEPRTCRRAAPYTTLFRGRGKMKRCHWAEIAPRRVLFNSDLILCRESP
ncbi:MAG: hypothetical protein A3D59_01935 [Candidatus Wildermuthbacteria bacterium RIFCSPHIGHO2_02_FULL_47_17]|uniref:Uncharacterized protein n=1 Tax=Candidatus Wildermuthbacteria bacterium RIFCSPHIGHO2_02_FULL_47_17 TaxID=1802452 RepID=A0A1G2R3X4_9BACT|nr:MAG: hypothetical protein A3D59_01935 [Candidatus Wildermuthbacteria bacterium RIFCSPHIGHO2_02_FULL_47_17]